MSIPDRRASKRRQILDAARALFLQHGFDRASTDAIATEAGVSKETLYRYYPSKEDLLVAVMKDLTVDRLIPTGRRGLASPATRDELESALIATVRDGLSRLMDADYLELARLAIGESGRRPHLGVLYRQAVPEAGARALIALLDDARSQGLLRHDLDVEVGTIGLVGPSIVWALTRGILAGGGVPDPPTDAWVAEVVRLFLDGAASDGAP